MSPKVIVAGGGIVGAAVSWQLAKAGAKVTLLEAGKFGRGATNASFAWLNSSNKTPREYHDLNVAGIDEYRQLQEELGDDAWLHWSGHVEWYGDTGGAARLREKVARLRDWGYPATLMPIIELPLVDFALVAPESVEEFAWYPGEGYVDPLPLIGRLLDAARDLGVVALEEIGVSNLIVNGDRVTGVESGDGERFAADVVVSCAGSATGELLRPLGVDLPLAPTVGMVAVSAPTTARMSVVHHDELMHIRPDGGGRVMMRHTDFDERVRPGQPVDSSLLEELRDRVATVLPGLAGAPVESARVAVRPIPADHQSVIGAVPGVKGLYLIVTHSAITLGPLLARLAATEILGGASDPGLAMFRPDRFSL
jgi:glycine/D-amino acid oxidase-like deaminating enzyme